MFAKRSLMFAILTLAACSYDSPAGGYGPGGNNALSGTYSGTATGSLGGSPVTLNVSFTLTHNGTTLNGSFSTDTGTTGTFTGTVDGSTVTFTISQANPCAGTFTGTANSGTSGRLAGSYSGTSPCSGSLSASFVVLRTY